MAHGFELLDHGRRNARLHGQIAAVKCSFGKARRFERSLDVHPEIHDVGNKLGMRLGLVPASHDAESDACIALLHERGNDGVQRTLVWRERVRMAALEREQPAPVLQREAGSGRHHS